jgi:hypothetical protein
MWLNFSWYNDMYIYWPVVLIGLTIIIIFLPARVLYHRSRKWFAFSNVSSYSIMLLLISVSDRSSGGFCLPESTQWSFVISSLATCTVLRHMLWGTSSSSSVYMPRTGTTLPSATPPTLDSWASSNAFPLSGELSNVYADTWTRRTHSHTS